MHQIIQKTNINNDGIIKPCNGTRTLMKAGSTFKAGIDYGSGTWDCHVFGIPTPETPFDIWNLKQSATFAEMFYSISSSIWSLCFTQDQIEQFCIDYPQLLGTDTLTFFLFKVDADILVAVVKQDGSQEKSVKVRWFKSPALWNSNEDLKIQIVTPRNKS